MIEYLRNPGSLIVDKAENFIFYHFHLKNIIGNPKDNVHFLLLLKII